jgi:streptogramin lyase
MVPATGANLWDIVTGPNGNLWFTEYGAGNIGTIAP